MTLGNYCAIVDPGPGCQVLCACKCRRLSPVSDHVAREMHLYVAHLFRDEAVWFWFGFGLIWIWFDGEWGRGADNLLPKASGLKT